MSTHTHVIDTSQDGIWFDLTGFDEWLSGRPCPNEQPEPEETED